VLFLSEKCPVDMPVENTLGSSDVTMKSSDNQPDVTNALVGSDSVFSTQIPSLGETTITLTVDSDVTTPTIVKISFTVTGTKQVSFLLVSPSGVSTPVTTPTVTDNTVSQVLSNPSVAQQIVITLTSTSDSPITVTVSDLEVVACFSTGILNCFLVIFK